MSQNPFMLTLASANLLKHDLVLRLKVSSFIRKEKLVPRGVVFFRGWWPTSICSVCITAQEPLLYNKTNFCIFIP